jgi:hypothetical protein
MLPCASDEAVEDISQLAVRFFTVASDWTTYVSIHMCQPLATPALLEANS